MSLSTGCGGAAGGSETFWRGFVTLRQVKFALPRLVVRAEEERREGHRSCLRNVGVSVGYPCNTIQSPNVLLLWQLLNWTGFVLWCDRILAFSELRSLSYHSAATQKETPWCVVLICLFVRIAYQILKQSLGQRRLTRSCVNGSWWHNSS